jgi:hypothetical protein
MHTPRQDYAVARAERNLTYFKNDVELARCQRDYVKCVIEVQVRNPVVACGGRRNCEESNNSAGGRGCYPDRADASSVVVWCRWDVWLPPDLLNQNSIGQLVASQVVPVRRNRRTSLRVDTDEHPSILNITHARNPFRIIGLRRLPVSVVTARSGRRRRPWRDRQRRRLRRNRAILRSRRFPRDGQHASTRDDQPSSSPPRLVRDTRAVRAVRLRPEAQVPSDFAAPCSPARRSSRGGRNACRRRLATLPSN